MVDYLDKSLSRKPGDSGLIATGLATKQSYEYMAAIFAPVTTMKGIPTQDILQYMKEIEGWIQLNLGNHDRAEKQEAKFKEDHLPEGAAIFFLSGYLVYWDGKVLYDTDLRIKSGRQKIRTVLVPPDSKETVEKFWKRAVDARVMHYGFDWVSSDFDTYYVKYGRRKTDRGGRWSK